MKQILSLSFLLALLGSGCVKDKDLVPLGSAGTPVSVVDPAQTFDKTGQQLHASGTFQNGVHTVSGTVKLYERNGKQTLVFEGFRSDTGPDLRIYLATDTQASSFTEVSMLTATGNFFVDVPAGVSLSQQRFVLIWCKRFAVHFGNAELK
ncbi:DM13 domain-containing protein [Spirosoma sp. KCTC 42546]|uniref:DM13 domain-containing protein n=1 Tax=Spirosoma sp. KCTC 42546 TaxID=2520506 RepID=UPI00115C3B75|nr:DM13 domain-containing protein [Spirosoma sp. KCTC 42546]QDK77562.1 DM13 domain-containing protein [Spirosoma sp. KCTC 42546]